MGLLNLDMGRWCRWVYIANDQGGVSEREKWSISITMDHLGTRTSSGDCRRSAYGRSLVPIPPILYINICKYLDICATHTWIPHVLDIFCWLENSATCNSFYKFMSRGKYYVFTLNNPTEEEIAFVKSSLSRGASYVTFGKETGTNGTPHLQGYVEFVSKLRLGGVKKCLGKRIHAELRKGSQSQAVEYCHKDGDVWSAGVLAKSKQGKRTDLEEIKEKILQGSTDLEIAGDYFSQWVVYRKSFSAYRQLCADKSMRAGLRVVLLYGAAGCGKTRLAYHCFPSLFRCPDPELRWFDGYRQEDVCLLDDYRGTGSPGFLLQLLDIYPLQVPVKGGFEPWTPKIIILTTNLAFPFGHDEIEAPLGRRIHRRYSFQGPLDFSDGDKVEELRQRLFE